MIQRGVRPPGPINIDRVNLGKRQKQMRLREALSFVTLQPARYAAAMASARAGEEQWDEFLRRDYKVYPSMYATTKMRNAKGRKQIMDAQETKHMMRKVAIPQKIHNRIQVSRNLNRFSNTRDFEDEGQDLP